MSYFLDQLLNGASLGTIYALVAMGFAMVYGVLKLLNFAHSEIFAASTFVAYFSLNWFLEAIPGHDLSAVLLSLLVAASAGGMLAVLIERIAYRPLRDQQRLMVLLTAIGVSSLLQNIGIQVFSGHTRGFPAVALPVSPKMFALFVLLGSYTFLILVVYRTDFGIRMRAVSEKSHVLELMGISPEPYIVGAFLLGGFFAGFAGVVWGVVYGTVSPTMGFYPGLKAFIIAVIGGIGSLSGTLLVGLSLGIIEAMVAGYLPSEYSGLRDSVVFLMLLGILSLRPHGLFGHTLVEKV